MEEKIALYMKNLGLTRDEAIDLIRDDEADVSVEITPEQAKVVKEMTQADRKKETAPRKRERKVDADKRFLVEALATALFVENAENIEIINPEREIQFDYRDAHFKIVLSKPRGEK